MVVHLLAIWQVTESGQSGPARQFGGLALVLLWDVGRRHMHVLEQMALHLPVHVYIQACLRYMHMAKHHLLTLSTILWVVAGTQPLVPSRDRSFDVAV